MLDPRSRKRYAFLLSRAISMVIALLFLYIVMVAWKFEMFDYFSAAIFLVVGTMSFLTLTGTYLAMTSLLYTAVVHPLRYRAVVSFDRCLWIIAAIWIVSVGSSVGDLFQPYLMSFIIL